MCVCVRACARVCVRACVRACVCVCDYHTISRKKTGYSGSNEHQDAGIHLQERQ